GRREGEGQTRRVYGPVWSTAASSFTPPRPLVTLRHALTGGGRRSCIRARTSNVGGSRWGATPACTHPCPDVLSGRQRGGRDDAPFVRTPCGGGDRCAGPWRVRGARRSPVERPGRGAVVPVPGH